MLYENCACAKTISPVSLRARQAAFLLKKKRILILLCFIFIKINWETRVEMWHFSHNRGVETGETWRKMREQWHCHVNRNISLEQQVFTVQYHIIEFSGLGWGQAPVARRMSTLLLSAKKIFLPTFSFANFSPVDWCLKNLRLDIKDVEGLKISWNWSRLDGEEVAAYSGNFLEFKWQQKNRIKDGYYDYK